MSLRNEKIETLSVLPGTRSDYTRPLILELFASGQGKEVLELLHSVNLEAKEVSRPPGFQIIRRGDKKK